MTLRRRGIQGNGVTAWGGVGGGGRDGVSKVEFNLLEVEDPGGSVFLG